jgi:3-methyladenine DNA glycosylase AlkC
MRGAYQRRNWRRLANICSRENFPQGDENMQAAEIPMPLFELAEALLGNKHKDYRLLNKLLSENDGLHLREV